MASKDLLYKVPTKSSTGNEWVAWHKAMKRFGKKNADILFTQAFAKRGSTDIPESMQNYFDDQGIPLDQNWLQGAKGIITDTTDFASDIFKTGTYVAVAMGGVLFISLSVLVFNIARTANANNVSSLMGRGK